ncbi:MAG: sigma-54 dependent transcriptional regulator, partial [Myxococcota bacterium]
LARERHHPFVLLDINMPGLDGLEVLDQLKHAEAMPRVILLSGYLDVETTRLALSRGAVEVLEKPVEAPRLLSIVRDLAKRHDNCSESTSELVVGRSVAIRKLRHAVTRAARFNDVPVLIRGETGTGKEILAAALHAASGCRGRLVSLNCAAVPESLFESELFGHEGGAFTGANRARVGLIETAENGTLFLDEVGELPPSQQTKLLRVLETRTYRRVGSSRELPVCARIVSATNRPEQGRETDALRSDLYFRLAGISLKTTPLRDRPEDVEALAVHFLAEFAERHTGIPRTITPNAIDALAECRWLGNARQLKNVVQAAAMRSEHDVIGLREIVESLGETHCYADCDTPCTVTPPASLPEFERTMIERVFEECDGNVSRAARKLGLPRTTVRDRLNRFKSR